jgi:hypothetical protein
MLKDIAPLVDLAALDHHRRATRVAQRLAEPGPAIDHEEHGAIEVEAALAQARQERLADGRVLRRALVQGEDVLLALGIHAQREQDHVVTEVQAIDQDDPEIEIVERRGEPG